MSIIYKDKVVILWFFFGIIINKMIKVFNIIVFFTWAVLLSVLLYRNYAGAPLEKPQAIKEFFEKQSYWYDIYAGKKKVGFASTSYEKAGNEIIIKDEREIKVIRNGKEDILTQKLKCLSDSSYSIKSFEYISHFKNEKGVKAAAEVDEEDIIFFLESAEKRKTFKTPLKGKGFYLPTTLIPALVQKNPAINSVFTVPMLDFSNLSINDIRVVLNEIKPIKVGANVLSLYKFKAGDMIWWSSEKGIVVKEENTAGMTLYSQIERIAKDYSDRAIFDYTNLPVLKSNILMPNPEKLGLLKIRIKGFRLDPQLYKDSVARLENNILTIKKEDISQPKEKTYTLPYQENRFHEYLNSDTWVRSDYKPLQDTGRIYARANNNDPFQFAKYLTGYLFQLIKSTPIFVLSDSENILKTLSGDYLERSVMFASYARAGGLPTRLVGGLVYINGYFYFHTWPEVWLDKWVPVDPTLAQFPADVTHIPLKKGSLEDIASAAKNLRSINIEILEAL